MGTRQNLDTARQQVLAAALRLAYAREASGGRETANASADLDHAEDMFDDELAHYVTAHGEHAAARLS